MFSTLQEHDVSISHTLWVEEFEKKDFKEKIPTRGSGYLE
jgi:hypothetical protein